MHVILTTCTAAKAPGSAPMPAGRRYRGPRVDEARARAAAEGRPLVFLSGVHGLLAAEAPLGWYDHALQPDEVAGLVGPVAAALRARGISRVTALVRPAATPGWAPYRALLAAACAAAGVVLDCEPPVAPGTD